MKRVLDILEFTANVLRVSKFFFLAWLGILAGTPTIHFAPVVPHF